ncbi:MAG TPA: hypothetical protein VGS28_00490 [Candidatus Saccharimonadales bacterium]|nr:hypothetical protein [Candidatus Saccharimonadales bacterium]
MKRVLQFIAIVGLIGIATAIMAILFAMTFDSIKSAAARDSFITAFGGAAFAYLFVKYGELFTRLQQREKLSLDTTVELEYLLNKHLNLIGTNLDVTDQMIKALKYKKRPSFLKFVPVPVGIIKLQNLKNTDFINDAFNYFADVEKINLDLEILQEFVEKLISDALATKKVNAVDYMLFQMSYQSNSTELISQLGEIKGFINKADSTAIELLGKIQYIRKHRAWWLSTPLPWSSTRHYSKKKLTKELPDYIASVKKGMQENIKQSSEEIAKATKRKKKPSKKSS